MKLFGFLIIFSIICSTFVVTTVVEMTDPEHPGKCVYEGLILSDGQSVHPEGKCILVQCYANGGIGMIHTCMGEADMSRCFVRTRDYINPGALYPECCEEEMVCAVD
ncbi:uncharacterized protein [Musca autumnalis]|uniref:uncharacterized protein n=1 Tax=Musca autumnalis TaxID=221902 RepID=UPI003CF99E07